ncbi:MAG: hypothetical protein V7K57_04735 [Nostoc sp.]|uniref:hypothetical protein n=1 Tax=Nostoc sp. TaxID=1180 RepID=UPI002FF825FE
MLLYTAQFYRYLDNIVILFLGWEIKAIAGSAQDKLIDAVINQILHKSLIYNFYPRQN